MYHLVIFCVLIIPAQNQLTANHPVACPSVSSVVFTCTLSGEEMQWIISPPPGISLSAAGLVSAAVPTLNLGGNGFLFRAQFNGVSSGMVTSTLTTVTSLTTLAGSMVRCEVVARGSAGPLPIALAGKFISAFT